MKISISQQIEEVELELKYRADVYKRLVSSGKMKASMAEYRTARMQAVLETLQWLSANRTKVLEELKKGAAAAPPKEAA